MLSACFPNFVKHTLAVPHTYVYEIYYHHSRFTFHVHGSIVKLASQNPAKSLQKITHLYIIISLYYLDFVAVGKKI